MAFDKEYIAITTDTSFRVYAPNKRLAIQRLLDECQFMGNTNSKDAKQYWETLYKKFSNEDNYILIENNDFRGVRAIID